VLGSGTISRAREPEGVVSGKDEIWKKGLPDDWPEGDQTSADADQTSADLDQTLADSDQSSADRDQRAADRDQHSADLDQAASDKAHASNIDQAGYARSRRARSQSALDRDLSAQARSDLARIRDENAARRDHVASERDAAARARDELADRLDREIERLEDTPGSGPNGRPLGMELVLRAAGDRKRAAASRARAAANREQAARDREAAAGDRLQGANDRAAAANELAYEGVDYLTGALRRRVGLIAVQREVDRTTRSGEQLVVAFVDVDALKLMNDEQGHAAGDELLRAVADCIKQGVRAYDVITRYGGDEFICSLAGTNLEGAQARFGQISGRLAAVATGATISVGLAQRREDEPLDELIARADMAMLEARGGR
jgi:diguanylate cyclase (GGDEF)-like protein